MKTLTGLHFHTLRQSTSIYTETHTMYTYTTYIAHTLTYILHTATYIYTVHTHIYTTQPFHIHIHHTHTVPAHGCVHTYMHTHSQPIWKSRDFIFKIVKKCLMSFLCVFVHSKQLSELRTS